MYASLPADLLALLVHHGGLVDLADMREIGVRERGVLTLRRRSLLVAVAKGVYTAGALLSALTPWHSFALRTAAFLRTAPDDAVAAGWSAVALHDLPTLGRPPSVPSAIRRARPPRGSDRSVWGRTRFASLADGWVMSMGGVAVLHPAATAVDVGQHSGRMAGLMVADAVARRLGGTDMMGQVLAGMVAWPRIGHARWAIARADADCETPLETLGRYAILRADLPRPKSNVWVGVDVPRYRLDHYWVEQRLALEGDGFGKYTMAHRGHDLTVNEALTVEKDRDFDLRAWGVMSERYTWRRALYDPRSVADRCSVALLGPRLPADPRLQWWPASEGYRILGMPMPREQLGAGPGWRQQVDMVLRGMA